MRIFRIGGTQVQWCNRAEELLQQAVGSVVELVVYDPRDATVDVDAPAAAPVATAAPCPMELDNRGPTRCCPVAVCSFVPEQASARGISSSFRTHLDDHIANDPSVLVTLRSGGHLRRFNVEQCGECGLLVSGPPGTAHPGECERRRAHRVRAPPTDSRVDEFALQPPSLHEIYAAQVAVRSSVPTALRFLWCKALHLTVSEVVLFSVPKPTESTEEGRRCLRVWAELSMIAKVCLCSPPRAGERRKRQSLNYTRRRIETWLEGPDARLGLWASLPKQSGGKRQDLDTDAQRAKRAERLAAEGRLGDAFKALCDPAPLPPDAERLKQMRAKHPRPQRGSGVDLAAPVPPTWEMDAGEIVEQLRKFPRGTAAGPSGLAVQHLLDALHQAHGESLPGSLAALVNILARGDAPRAVAKHLAGAKLVALPKQPSGLRPVAVGETLRRLVARCLCAKVRSRAAEKLAPYQFGFGVAGGGEALVHCVRQWVERASSTQDDTARVALCLDFENAFNLIERDTFLSVCRREFPELVGFAEFCYAEETELLFAGCPVSSCTGVQQGDPLGPLLFCLCLREMLSRAFAEQRIPAPGPDFLPHFFLDDGVLCGRAECVRAALQAILDLGPHLGFKLNLGKCKLLKVSEASLACDLFPAEIEQVREIALLKSPLGGDVFCDEYAIMKVESLQQGLDRLAAMEHAQTAFRILAVCAGSGRMSWLARTTPPRSTASALQLFDERVRCAFERIAGTVFSEIEWAQVVLGTARGGLGLRQIAVHAPAAYVGSRAATHSLCARADPLHVWDGSCPGSHLCDAIEAVTTRLPSGCTLLRETGPAPPDVRQFDLSQAIDTAIHQELLSYLDTQGQARLRSCSVQHAAAWVTAPPAHDLGLRLTTPQFQSAVRLWVGSPIMESGRCACGAISDQLGNHALHCRFGGGTIRRHNRIRDILFHACGVAGLLPELEKPGILPGGEERPADVFVNRWPGGGPALLALDVAVVSPTQTTYVRGAANAALTAATAYSDKKANKDNTEARCREKGIRFQPMVVETFGAWSDEARRQIKSIADLTATRTAHTHQPDAARALFQKLSVALMRENAQTLLDKQQQQAGEDRLDFRDRAQREREELEVNRPTTNVFPLALAAAPEPVPTRSPTPVEPESDTQTPPSSTPDGVCEEGPTGTASGRPLPSPSAPPSLLTTSPHSPALSS
jgi:hypothetical protein